MPVWRVIFMGSPSFAVPSLRAVAKNFQVTAVYTQPPRPAGRGQEVAKTPVHIVAEELGLTVRHPEKLKGEALEKLMATPTEAIAVVAYGLLLPKQLVESRTCLNVHPSALPRWRGAAPIPRTLMAGDVRTEVCIMKLDEGMDTGPVYVRENIELPIDMTAGKLHDLCAAIGAESLVSTLRNLDDLTPVPQKGESTHAAKITAEDRVVDWAQPAATVHNRIRGLAPSPGAVAKLGGEDIKILRSEIFEGYVPPATPGTILSAEGEDLIIGCGQGAVRLTYLQRPGKKPMLASELLRGWKPAAPQG